MSILPVPRTNPASVLPMPVENWLNAPHASVRVGAEQDFAGRVLALPRQRVWQTPVYSLAVLLLSCPCPRRMPVPFSSSMTS
jgi:hypothetical protein